MKAFFSSLQTNRNKYVGGNNNSSSNSPSGNPGSVPALQLSTDSSSPTTTSGNNITSQPIKSPRNRNKGSQNNPKFVSSLKLDNSNLVPFIDILEETVKQKIQHPNIILKITDNPQVIDIVNDFANGLCTKYSLESQEFSDLWSAIVKIIQISDPILTAANCDTLQHLDSGPLPTETSATIINRLPVFHQRLLGALFSACDMLIRLDANVASALAGSASNALIWNSAPNSPENKLAFTSFVRHCSENFPYYFTFANRIGLSVKPVESKEWMAILTEGNSGVIIGNSAAINPNYSHNNPSNPSNPISPSNSLMQSIDLSSSAAAVTDKTRSSTSSLPPRNREGGGGGSDPSNNNNNNNSGMMGGRDRGGERGGSGLGLSLELFDKRSNTPNNMSLASSSSRDSNYSPAATMMINNNSNPNPNPNTIGSSGRQSEEDGEAALPRKGIAMKPSNENIHSNNSSSFTNNKNNNNRATEGRISSEDDWDEEQEAENKDKNGVRKDKKETPAAAPPAPKTVKLKDLQNVFSSSLVSASSLEYRSFRNIDYNEDYADLK
jgi:hypothetical protein